jgi:hypothetical protein
MTFKRSCTINDAIEKAKHMLEKIDDGTRLAMEHTSEIIKRVLAIQRSRAPLRRL